LLSREYMQLVASHLRPGGIAAINSTFSGDVLVTAREVFPFVERRFNFVYGSQADFSHATATAEQAFREPNLNGTAVFAEPAYRPGGLVRNMIDTPFVPHDEQFKEMSLPPEVITDQNLVVEQAHGKVREHLPHFSRVIAQLRGGV